MTDKERQQKRRKKLKQEGKKQVYVRGVDGEYDERIRIAKGVKALANKGLLSEDIINHIIKASIETMPPNDNVNKIYITKLLKEYLKKEN